MGFASAQPSYGHLHVVIVRSEADEAIHRSACGGMDCFAEPVIGPRCARTRWLAITTAIETAPPYSVLSMFQKIGVAGPSSTPVSDLRQALGD